MKTAFQIFSRDIRRLSHNKAAIIVMIGVCVLPSLYAWFNIAANMDPYGNTQGIKVAVANNDTGSETDKLSINAGDTIIENLRENSQLGWTFVDEKQAEEGVRSGKYYAAIIIPDDFSDSLLSILSGKIEKPKLDYYINEKKNAIAPKITDTGATTVQQEINETFSSVASETISGIIRSAADQLTNDMNAADSQLITAVSDVRSNLAEYQTALGDFQETVKGSETVIKETIDTLDKVDSASDAAAAAFEDTSFLLYESRSALSRFSAQISGSLSQSEILINDISISASAKLGTFEANAQKATADVGNAIDSVSELNEKNEKLLQSLAELNDNIGNNTELSAIIGEQIKHLQSQNETYEKILDSLSGGNDSVKNILTTAKDTRLDLEKISIDGRQSMQDSRKAFEQNTLPKVNKSLDDLASVSGSLSATLSATEPMTKQIKGILQQFESSLDMSLVALEQTGEVLERVDENLNSVMTDISALQSSGTYQQLLSLEGIDPQSVSRFMASPVSLKSEVLYDVENYGSGMTPFYTNLALWVGGLILVSILKQEVDQEGFIHRFDTTDAYFGRWLLFSSAALIQGFIVCTGDLILLKTQCMHPTAFLLAGMFCSFVYVNIIYALAITFKHIGKAVAVLLVILQIPGSSGTYPIEMMPGFFQKVHPLFPFTYGIDAMRESMAGFYENYYIKDLLILLIFILISLLTGLVLRPLILNLNHMFDKHLEETDLMIGETDTVRNENPQLQLLIKALLRHDEGKQKFMARSAKFEAHYPKMIKYGFICMIAIPLFFLILMFSLESRIVFLVLWIVSLIGLSIYLICVEYIHDRVQRQIKVSGLTSENLIDIIEEEKSK